jgi:hypothetical protein
MAWQVYTSGKRSPNPDYTDNPRPWRLDSLSTSFQLQYNLAEALHTTPAGLPPFYENVVPSYASPRRR